MSFQLHLHTCNIGTNWRHGTNPFTGKLVEFPIDVGLTDSERSAVRAFLEESQAAEPDPETYCRVALPDGTVVNVAIGTLCDDDPCVAFALECSALSPEIASFVHELGRRGNMSIGSTIDPAVVALPLSVQAAVSAPRWPSAVVVATPAQLFGWLRVNIERGGIV